MRYFTQLLSRFAKGENATELLEKRLTANKYHRLGYSVLHQYEEQSTSELQKDSSGEDDLHLQHSQMVTKGAYNMRQEFENSYEELVDSKRKILKIRIILIVLTTLFFAALVVVAVILIVSKTKTDTTVGTKGIELDRIVSGQLAPKRFNGSWTADNQIIYKNTDGHILAYNVATGNIQPLVQIEDEQITQSFLYEKSADSKYLLIARGHTKIFRHSFAAIYSVVDLNDGKIYPVTINDKEEHLLLVKWSPVGNALIINFDRNLYYKPSALDKEVQLTSDTNHAIINGHPDWVYEEEVFGSNVAVWFNPNGTKIAYIQFDDTSTRVINLPFYGAPGDLNYQYPGTRSVFYPKAGSSNPFIKLYQVDLKVAVEGREEAKSEVLVPGELNTEEHIITAVEWISNDSILSVWMNRIQNRAYIQVSDNTHRYEIYRIESKTGWVDLFTPLVKNLDGSQVALILPQKQGEIGDYKHLHILSTKNSPTNRPIPLTKGQFVVRIILHWDSEFNLIFYAANQPDKSEVLHIFAVKAERGQISQCITCGMVINGVEQTYFSADFNTLGKYVIITSLGPSTPKVDIYKWSYTKGNISLDLITEWETNHDINSYLTEKNLPEIEYHTIDIGDGFTAKVLLQLPPGIDRSGSTKYPMLIDVYGGPDSFAVTDRWIIDWGTYLSSNRSIIYAKIDGRGSGLRGEKLLHSIYLKLGTVEIYDQLNVTRKLQTKLPYIDANRTGIWGWSYGGYAAALALAYDDSGIFKCATSVAPVTDWAYYDSIYTERYMGLPKENSIGYQKSRLTTQAYRFEGKRLMLVHGTLDDNVHYQQSMIFAKNLERNDILFRQINYADEDHGLFGVRPHLYHSLDNFFGECFGIDMGRTYGK